MPNSAIQETVVYVTDIGAALAARQAGGAVRRVPPKTMISTADAQLGLNGSLLSYMDGRGLKLESAPEMSSAEWDAFLNQRFTGRSWRRWFGKTPTAIYSVVVVFDASSVGATQAPADADKTFQVQTAAGQVAKTTGEQVCPSCHAPLAPAAVLCIDCGFDRRTGRQMRTQRESGRHAAGFGTTGLTSDQTRASEQRAQVERGKRTCSACGESLLPLEKRCPKCGQAGQASRRVQSARQVDVALASDREKRLARLRPKGDRSSNSGGLIAVVLMIGFGLYVWSKESARREAYRRKVVAGRLEPSNSWKGPWSADLIAATKLTGQLTPETRSRLCSTDGFEPARQALVRGRAMALIRTRVDDYLRNTDNEEIQINAHLAEEIRPRSPDGANYLALVDFETVEVPDFRYSVSESTAGKPGYYLRSTVTIVEPAVKTVVATRTFETAPPDSIKGAGIGVGSVPRVEIADYIATVVRPPSANQR